MLVGFCHGESSRGKRLHFMGPNVSDRLGSSRSAELSDSMITLRAYYVLGLAHRKPWSVGLREQMSSKSGMFRVRYRAPRILGTSENSSAPLYPYLAWDDSEMLLNRVPTCCTPLVARIPRSSTSEAERPSPLHRCQARNDRRSGQGFGLPPRLQKRVRPFCG